MKKSPAFQWYPADYLADMQVRMLSWAGRGVYVELLCFCWREGYIPSDSSAIAKLLNFDDIATIDSCLRLFSQDEKDPSKMLHKRLDEERSKQEAHRKERSESGKKGAEKVWKDRNGSATAKPIAKDGSSSSSASSPSKSKETKETPNSSEHLDDEIPFESMPPRPKAWVTSDRLVEILDFEGLQSIIEQKTAEGMWDQLDAAGWMTKNKQTGAMEPIKDLVKYLIKFNAHLEKCHPSNH